MSFWQLSDDKKVESNKEYEMEGGNLTPIPDDTVLKAMPTQAQWAEYQGDRYINLRWDVIDGEYKGRVIFHKLKVYENDPKKADKAKRMLAAIDANAGGSLVKLDREPGDVDLASALCNKPMHIKVKVWEMEGDDGVERKGNWICAVSSMATPTQPAATKPAAAGGIGF